MKHLAILGLLCLFTTACQEATAPRDVASFRRDHGTLANSFSINAALSSDLLVAGSPITSAVDLGFGFSSITEVDFFFTFGSDPLDPGECLTFGPGFCNPGTAPQSTRLLTIPCSNDPATCDLFRDGGDTRELVASRWFGTGEVSMRIASLVITIQGTPDLTSAAQCKEGLWKVLGFTNQGQCMSFVQTGK